MEINHWTSKLEEIKTKFTNTNNHKNTKSKTSGRDTMNEKIKCNKVINLLNKNTIQQQQQQPKYILAQTC